MKEIHYFNGSPEVNQWFLNFFFQGCDLAISKWKLIATHQAHKDAEKLHHVGVRHRVQSSNKGVEDRNHGRDHHRHVDVDVYDHAQGGTCGNVLHCVEVRAISSADGKWSSMKIKQISFCRAKEPFSAELLVLRVTVPTYPGPIKWLQTRRSPPWGRGWRAGLPSSSRKAAGRDPA